MTELFSSLPAPELFRFPPMYSPEPIPPVRAPISVMHPFNIPDLLFTAALDAKVPLCVAALYAVTVKALNRYNRSNGKKPWAISKTKPFSVFVVLHNILLAVYSAWTFWGMLGGMRRSIVSPLGPRGLAGTADSFCRNHGYGGIGQSVYFNDTTSQWDSVARTPAIVSGLPSGTAPGRMWNEGLAYYGWIFYLSKFYEVLDTFIILAKGKPSSTLQTYHHAGAMLCMWAGMRYMASPIWIFVVYNSFIHSLMYTYYTLTAFSVKIPLAMKRGLTAMQITQFVVGASYAVAHSFVSYYVPVKAGREGSAMAAGVPGPTTAGALDSLKQMLLGSAASAPSQAKSASLTETTYILQPCILSAGENFAIWLNFLYLAPLTYLFVSFFIASYVKRSNAAQKLINGKTRRPSNVTLAEKAGWDAARGIEKEVYGGEGMVSNGSQSNAVADQGSGQTIAPKRPNGRPKRK